MNLDKDKRDEFKRRLAALINEYSLENDSDTPDFILAEYLYYCLESFAWASNRRRTWYGDGAK